MFLLISHHHDAEAQWLYRTLVTEYGIEAIHLLPEALGLDYSVSLQLNNHEGHSFTISFYEPKRLLESREITYAVNRLSYIDPILWHSSAPSEKAYAATELNAFFPALIHSLPCEVSNRVHNGSLYADGGLVARIAIRLRQQGIAVDPSVTKAGGNWYETLNATPAADQFRFLYNEQKVFSPPGQQGLSFENEIRESLLTDGGKETLEAIFINTADGFRLIHISRTPAVSCYRRLYTDSLMQQITKSSHDFAFRHT